MTVEGSSDDNTFQTRYHSKLKKKLNFLSPVEAPEPLFAILLC
jgi:hypothetical protein